MPTNTGESNRTAKADLKFNCRDLFGAIILTSRHTDVVFLPLAVQDFNASEKNDDEAFNETEWWDFTHSSKLQKRVIVTFSRRTVVFYSRIIKGILPFPSGSLFIRPCRYSLLCSGPTGRDRCAAPCASTPRRTSTPSGTT